MEWEKAFIITSVNHYIDTIMYIIYPHQNSKNNKNNVGIGQPTVFSMRGQKCG